MTSSTPVASLDRSLIRAVAWNAAAKWACQILSWASTVLVARLLTPYDYGLVGMAGFYLGLATLISQFGVPNVIIALRDVTDEQIAELNTISMIMGISLVILSYQLALPLARFFSTPALHGVIIMVSGTYFISAFQVVPKALLRKELRFKLLSAIELVSTISQVIATVLLAWLNYGYWSLVGGYIASAVVGSVLTICWRRHGFAVPRLGRLRRELRFTRHVLSYAVAWYAYDNADFGVAGRALGGTALGNYTIAWTIASAPLEKISNLVTNVILPYFAAVQNNQAELRRYLLRLTEILSLVTVPASIGLALAANFLIPALLGPKWLGVIGPLRLLGLFVAGRSIAAILPNLLHSIGDARFVMWATIASAVTMPIAFLIGSRWGTNGIAAAWVVAYPVVMVPIYRRVFRKIGMRGAEYVAVLIPALSGSAVMTAVVLIAGLLMPANLPLVLSLFLIVAIGVVSYIGALLAFHYERTSHLIRTITVMCRRGETNGQITTPSSSLAVKVVI